MQLPLFFGLPTISYRQILHNKNSRNILSIFLTYIFEMHFLRNLANTRLYGFVLFLLNLLISEDSLGTLFYMPCKAIKINKKDFGHMWHLALFF